MAPKAELISRQQAAGCALVKLGWRWTRKPVERLLLASNLVGWLRLR